MIKKVMEVIEMIVQARAEHLRKNPQLANWY